MNPRRLKLRNCRTFVELDLTLPEGRLAILGDNGAGKSTLATAVDWALFGPDARSWAPYLTQGAEQTEMLLELEFDHDGEAYRIRRGYSGRGSGKATLDLERDASLPGDPDEGVFVPLTRETAKQTQELVETLLGLTRETFRASSMLVQGDGAAFTEAQPRDRKAILARILGLERWDVYLAACRTDIRTREQRLDQIKGELAGVDEELEQRDRLELAIEIDREILADAEKQGDAAKVEHDQAEQAIRAAAANDALRAVATARVAQAELRLEPLNGLIHAAAGAVFDRGVAFDELAVLSTRDQVARAAQALADLRARDRERELLVAQAGELERTRAAALARQADLLADAETAGQASDALLKQAAAAAAGQTAACEACGQPLTNDEAREHAAGHLTRQANLQQQRRRTLTDEAAAIEIPDLIQVPPADPELAAAIQAAELAVATNQAELQQRARLEERIRTLDQTIANAPTADAVKEAEDELTAARQALAAVPAATDPHEVERLTATRTRAGARVEEERIRWQQASADLARNETRLAAIVKLAERAAAGIADRERIHAELDDLKVLERAYGRDGIPAWIVSRVALPSIQAEGTRILGELGTSYQVELRTERATADGGTTDALDVIVITPDGERPYETFSGGERTRINLALRIALARLLANRRRGESRLLVIDEPEFLDAAGTDALVRVLAGLVDFSRIWLISHVPALRDAALDGTIEVARGEDGWSTVTVS